MVKRTICGQAGFALIELLLAVMILSLVLAGAYSYFSFGWGSFTRGTEAAVVNHNLRFAAETITEEVRFAFFVEILSGYNSIPEMISSDDIYVFVNEDKKIEIKNNETARIIPTIEEDDLAISLTFEKNADNDNLFFRVVDLNGGSAIDTEVKILNLVGSISGLNQGSALRIRRIPPAAGNDQMKTIDNVIASPAEHKQGTVQVVSLGIYTSNVDDNEAVSVDFIDPDGETVHFTAAGSISGNAASVNIDLNDSTLATGTYLFRITVNSCPNPYYLSYNIVDPDIVNVTMDPHMHTVGTAQALTVTIQTKYVDNDESVHVKFLYNDGINELTTGSGTIQDNSAVVTLNLADSIAAGTYIIRVNVDTVQYPYDLNYYINALPPLILADAPALPDATENSVYAGHIFEATGGQPPYSFDVSGGSLPAGLGLSGAALEGTPTEPGLFTFTLTVTDNAIPANTDSREFTLNVNPADSASFIDYLLNHKVLLFGNNISLTGSAVVVGSTSTVIIRNSFSPGTASNTYILAKTIYINDSISMQNYALGTENGSVYVNGDVSISGGSSSRPRILGDLYYTGTLQLLSNLSEAVIAGTAEQVAEINLPDYELPALRQSGWYADKGYSSGSTASNNMKYYGGTFSFPTWGNYSNVIIASTGDVNITGSVSVSGLIVAPNAGSKVTISSSGPFTGVIIADEIAISGSASVTFVSIADYFNHIDDYPFEPGLNTD